VRSCPQAGSALIKLATRTNGSRTRVAGVLVTAVVLLSGLAVAQTQPGEIRVRVCDPQGLPAQVAVQIDSVDRRTKFSSATNSAGDLFQRLPDGVYVVRVMRSGFNQESQTVRVYSSRRVQVRFTLSVAPVESAVAVRGLDALIDSSPDGSSKVQLPPSLLEKMPPTRPARALIDVVASQPGWVLESNATLHPRGAENQVQYVVNGVPLTDNRSLAFAAPLSVQTVDSLAVITGGFPAEYGRKLGGVIAVSTKVPQRDGLHGAIGDSGGSFNSNQLDAELDFAAGRNSFAGAAHWENTNRYLDPPVTNNFDNAGTDSGGDLMYERSLGSDRLILSVDHGTSAFHVPNELIQEQAGQDQRRDNSEIRTAASYEHVVNSDTLLDLSAMGRSVSAGLRSNASSTPVLATQQRGFTEIYGKVALSAHRGVHDLKAGVDLEERGLNELFSYQITAPSFFSSDTLSHLQFRGSGVESGTAAFVDDTLHFGQLTLRAGLRYDYYSLLVSASP